MQSDPTFEASAESLRERLQSSLGDRYAIEGLLGAGGTGTVFTAHDRKHDRKVALKVLRPELAESLGTERFLREIRFAARLSHPHLVPVYDSGEADGLLYYVMPVMEGESLRALLDREGPLGVEDAVRIGREIADGLAHAHESGIVHRDVKPGNILLSGGHALLSDFGIARAFEVAQDTHTGNVVVGTPGYMSPEQISAGVSVDERSDIYSLACVLFEMLTGRPPSPAGRSRPSTWASCRRQSRRRVMSGPRSPGAETRWLQWERRAVDGEGADALCSTRVSIRTPSSRRIPALNPRPFSRGAPRTSLRRQSSAPTPPRRCPGPRGLSSDVGTRSLGSVAGGPKPSTTRPRRI
ncbi:MAG TPA: protein kinase [Longimicrobiales bacterium]|nr:protein kinase [Longimicrobiales bacterium]